MTPDTTYKFIIGEQTLEIRLLREKLAEVLKKLEAIEAERAKNVPDDTPKG